MFDLNLESVFKLQESFECNRCGKCCRNLPGFFLPGDDEAIQKLARFLGIDESALTSKYLVMDYRQPFGEKYWFWTPAVISKEGKRLVPLSNKNGDFYREDSQKIYCSQDKYPFVVSQITAAGGHCIFWDDRSHKCIIHPVKPTSCRLFNCRQQKINLNNWLYYHYFGGRPEQPPKIKKISYEEWGICWDFYCPCCGEDEVEQIGRQFLTEDTKGYSQRCNNCGYEFLVY
ncbi:MAG TPA: hypothetical protein GXX38_01330 [Clostridia bacterium]|jgi:Fe-S-cluster containining protein|nr:hypothetical protein [Clostridia bacterium]